MTIKTSLKLITTDLVASIGWPMIVVAAPVGHLACRRWPVLPYEHLGAFRRSKGSSRFITPDPMPVETVGEGRHAWRYIIPKGKKEDLAKELQRLRVNTLSVFPDLDNVAAYAEEVVRATL